MQRLGGLPFPWPLRRPMLPLGRKLAATLPAAPDVKSPPNQSTATVGVARLATRDFVPLGLGEPIHSFLSLSANSKNFE